MDRCEGSIEIGNEIFKNFKERVSIGFYLGAPIFNAQASLERKFRRYGIIEHKEGVSSSDDGRGGGSKRWDREVDGEGAEEGYSDDRTCLAVEPVLKVVVSSYDSVFKSMSGNGEMSDGSAREVSLETSKEVVVCQVVLKIELEFLGKRKRGL